MRRLQLLGLSCVLICSSLLASSHVVSEPVTRDWTQYPAIVSISAPEQIYALGDVHGDYDRLAQLLVVGKIIDAIPSSPEAAHWAAGRTVLVSTGDLIDKYNQSMPVIALLRALQPQALAAGGRVIVNLGNHEAEFLATQGDDKKAADFSAELNAAGIAPTDVALGRDSAGIGQWLRNLPAGTKIGDWFFCHAGNTGQATLSDLTNDIQQQVSAQGWSAPILANPNSMLEARMHPRPWWDSDGSEPKLKDVEKPAKDKEKEKKSEKKSGEKSSEEQNLFKTIETLGVKHLVFGHQPDKVKFLDGSERAAGQMYSKYNGLVFMIDTGMSRGVQSGRGALLQIRPTDNPPSATAVYIDGATAVLWK